MSRLTRVVELQDADGCIRGTLEVPSNVACLEYIVWNHAVYRLHGSREAPRSWEPGTPTYRQVFAWWHPEGR